ncbi:hypothetical protein Tco_0350927 [Tanacetum coccineum]
MGTFIQTPAEDAEETEPERARVFTDLSAEEKERYKAGIRATNILLQGSTSTDNLIESLTNTLALLQTSSNARNNATVQDDKVVVQDVRGRYNAKNQGRPFQRNNARGNVEAMACMQRDRLIDSN